MTVNTPQNASLMDSIGDGYRAVHRRPLLLLLPIFLNLAFWFSTPFSLAPLMQGLVEQLAATNPADPSVITSFRDMVTALSRTDPLPQMVLLQRNLAPILAPRVIDAASVPTIGISSFGLTIGLFLLVNMVMLAISAPFLTGLAQAVRNDRLPPRAWLRLAGKLLLGMLAYLVMIVVGGLVIGAPFILLASLFLAIAPPLAFLILFLLSAVWFWLTLYVGFTPEAIAVSGIGPVQAVRASFQIVRRNFWGTLGLLMISLVVTSGMTVIWQQLINSTSGLLLAILGSTYIGSGLLAARMAFYRERLRRWQTSVGGQGRVPSSYRME